jgi:hypothetical protein
MQLGRNVFGPAFVSLSVESLRVRPAPGRRVHAMIKFLLWCILFVLCWPLALLALIAYPFVWLILVPFRLVGIAVDGVLELVGSILYLPVRLIRAI